MELESDLFLVVGSEPSLDFAEGCGFSDSSYDVGDAVLCAELCEG